VLIIGELLNGMYQDVRKAIQARDTQAIQDLARRQTQAGANVLDVNTGPASAKPLEAMQWLVDTIQEAVDTPLAIDSTKPDVIEAALKMLKAPGMINSTTADPDKLNTLLPLAREYSARIIGLTMDKSGVPRDKDKRLEHAATIISTAMEHGVDLESIYIDPIVLPVNVVQPQAPLVLEAISEFSMISDPPPKTVVGLSNVSQGSAVRPLINRIYLVMAIANGLDAAIVDPLDTDLVDAAITAELLLNKHIYCDSFLQAYRK
jgi:5-methyltetrahydrofolate corrinoid/iron sulfur protein methyltransferase